MWREQSSTELILHCHGRGRRKRKHSPVSKACISSWLVEVIKQATENLKHDPPVGVKAHSTRAQATSWAALVGVDPSRVYKAATWAGSCTFANHYDLNLLHNADAGVGAAVLTTAFTAGNLPKTSLKGYVILRK